MAEKEAFKVTLAEKIANVATPHSMVCRDPKCDELQHRNDSDDYIEEVLKVISDSATETLPVTSGGGNKSPHRKETPGWKEHVQPYRGQARFWHSIWLSAGKPMNCELHNIMCRTRNCHNPT